MIETNSYQQNHRGVFRSTDADDRWDRIDVNLPRIYSLTATVAE